MLSSFKKASFILFTFIIASIFTTTGCDVEDHLKEVDVIVGGGYELGDNSYTCYWVNGDRTDLNNRDSDVDVYGDGDDVYAVSRVHKHGDPAGKATMWLNGTARTLVDDWSGTREVVVDNGQVHVLGYTFNEGFGTANPWLWIDGLFYNLDGDVWTMHIENGNIYLAGSRGDNDRRPCYWINGERFDLDSSGLDLSSLSVNGIAVMGEDVYCVGSYYDTIVLEWRACMWINGVRSDLETESSVSNSIEISGSDVYISGQYQCNACYWKNGNRVILNSSSSCSIARDITVVNGDAYIAGNTFGSDSRVYVWKNNSSTKAELEYPWSINRDGTAQTIFVKAKN